MKKKAESPSVSEVPSAAASDERSTAGPKRNNVRDLSQPAAPASDSPGKRSSVTVAKAVPYQKKPPEATGSKKNALSDHREHPSQKEQPLFTEDDIRDDLPHSKFHKYKKHPKTKMQKKVDSTVIFAIGFALIILTGTVLLTLPISSADGSFTNPLDAGFTAVSATCVTGLITLDTATHWNTFGHFVIMVLIQIGGLGFMTFAVLLSVMIGRHITPKEQMLVAMSYSLSDFGGTKRLMKRILWGTLLIEGTGALLLSTRFIPDFGFWPGIRKSIFHSVSAFCNAGFDTVGIGNSEIASMYHYVSDPVINFTITFLIIFGGIGFLVWSDLINAVFHHKRLSVYTKFVLVITAVLLIGGTVCFALIEWNNPKTLGSLPTFGEKIMASFFQSTSWRTAGFATLDNGAFSEKTELLGILLMFVGGASGSTAGGVKVATMGILVYAVFCVFIGKKHTVVFGRSISDSSFSRATSVIFIQATVVLTGAAIIAGVTDFSLIDILYEAVSAISTVGVSAGITAMLPSSAKVTVMLLMYFGRVGILTVSYALLNSLTKNDAAVSYPEAKMLIG